MQTNFQREQSLHKMEGENIQNCILTHWAKHQCRDNLSECFSCFVDLWRLLNMTGQWALQGARPSDQLLQWWGHCSDPALVTAPGSLMSHRPQCWPHPVSLHCPPDGQPHWWPLTGRCFDSGPLRNCVVGGRGISGSYLAHWLRRWLRVRESLCCQAPPARINNCITPTATPLSLRAEASPDQSRPTNKKLFGHLWNNDFAWSKILDNIFKTQLICYYFLL